MKRNLPFPALLLSILLLGGCRQQEPSDNGPGRMKGAADIAGKRIGVLVGSVYDKMAHDQYPDAEIMQYSSPSDLLIALNTDKIDVLYYDEASLPEVLKVNPGIGVLAHDLFSIPIGAGFNSLNGALREQFNTFLREIKSNGVYADMVERWMVKGDMNMPDVRAENPSGVLRAGVINDAGMPFGLIHNGKLIGFDIELSSRFAAYAGRAYEAVPLQFGSLIASITTNKIDIITASMFVTEEREKMIDFADPYYQSGVSLIALKDRIGVDLNAKMATRDDLAGRKIGVLTGTIHDGFLQQAYPTARLFRYDGVTDMILSVETGKIDASLMDHMTARQFLRHNASLAILTDDILSMDLGVGFSKGNPVLRDEYNAFLKEIRADGTYDTIYKRWMIDDPEKAVMPVFPPSNGKKIIAGVSIDDLPWVAWMNNDYAGIDIELIRTFAHRRGYQVEFTTLKFATLIAALAAGKVDLISDGIAITEERKKQIDFSDSYSKFRTAVVVHKKNLAGPGGPQEAAPARKPFFGRVADSFYSNIILEDRYLLILDGLWITILISIFSALFGTLLAGLVCWMRMSKNVFLSATAGAYINLLRGTPVLVLLMIIYYIVFASVNINPVLVAVIAFGLNFGAYVSEMFRTSIQSIDRGQSEAGVAGGFTKVEAFVHIIAPQALRHLLPVYKGEFISLVKMTSIVGYIAVQDLTKASDIIRSRTFDAFFPLLMAAVIYLALAWLLTWALGKVELSVDPKRKRIIQPKEAQA